MLKIAPSMGYLGDARKVCVSSNPGARPGYWARKESGKTVSRKPLSAAKNLPAVHRANFR